MNIRWVRGGTILFFLLFVCAVTWPGMTLGNRIRPMVFGLPLSMVWIAAWVALSFLVLALLDLLEGRTRSAGTSGRPDAGAAGQGRHESGKGE